MNFGSLEVYFIRTNLIMRVHLDELIMNWEFVPKRCMEMAIGESETTRRRYGCK